MKTNVISGSYITDVVRVDEADMNLKISTDRLSFSD